MITTRSARVAILQATACGRETRERIGGGGLGSSGPQIAHGLQCGVVLAAIERSPLEVQDWLLTAYAAPGYPGVEQSAIRCQAALYAAYTRQRTIRTDPQRMFTLAAVVMYDLRQRCLGDGARGIAWYAGQVRFKRQNWLSWARSIEGMLGLLDAWDRRGLAEVAAVLAKEP